MIAVPVRQEQRVSRAWGWTETRARVEKKRGSSLLDPPRVRVERMRGPRPGK